MQKVDFVCVLRYIYLYHEILEMRLHETGSVSNRCESGTDKPCVYTEPGRSVLDRFSYRYQMGSLVRVIHSGAVLFHGRTAPL